MIRSNKNNGMRTIISSLLLLLTTLPVLVSAAKERNTNVFGFELENCSTKGMAMTGITGSGHCVHFDELHHSDRSHTICVDIPSFSDAYYFDDDTLDTEQFRPNFFTATGQPNLEEMPCTEDATRQCPIQNWCINEEDFASYVDYVGGCEKIGRILCQSTNMEAIAHYENVIFEGASKDERTIENALDCLKYKCWIN